MINISEEQKEILNDYIEDLENHIENDDIQDFLDLIDDEIVNNILGNNDEPDDEGIKLQKVYDQTFNQN